MTALGSTTAAGGAGPRRPPAHIGAVRSVLIERSAEDTMTVLRDIELLEPLERKAREVEVHPETDRSGWYRIVGRLAGLARWEGDFRYDQHDAGWHSRDLHPREDQWAISGGFLVNPIGPAMCRVTHYEDYFLPPRLRWMWLPMAVYMRWSQVGEMRDLVRLVESQLPAAVDPGVPAPVNATGRPPRASRAGRR
ncbi:MAG: hypothetical protein M3042_05095 [Actinomycetota bacterium]|nr:hypothetical protein [Actinomycetota bacterium]